MQHCAELPNGGRFSDMPAGRGTICGASAAKKHPAENVFQTLSPAPGRFINPSGVSFCAAYRFNKTGKGRNHAENFRPERGLSKTPFPHPMIFSGRAIPQSYRAPCLSALFSFPPHGVFGSLRSRPAARFRSVAAQQRRDEEHHAQRNRFAAIEPQISYFPADLGNDRARNDR